jgi:hypothetical protein
MSGNQTALQDELQGTGARYGLRVPARWAILCWDAQLVLPIKQFASQRPTSSYSHAC